MKRIALDTGVARELYDTEPDWFSTFVKMTYDGWSFHLTDISIGELIAAKERGAIQKVGWEQIISRLSKLLISEFPCLPGARGLFHLCGFRDKEDPNTEVYSENYQRLYSKAGWETLKTGKEATFIVDNKKFICPIKSGEASRVLKDERQKWIDEMDKIAKASQPDCNDESKVLKIKSELDSWAETSGLAMSIRGDILTRALVKYERKLANGYKASSNKRKNDGPDFLLFYTFMWPALLVTTDKKFTKLVRSLNSFQSLWIFSPDELATAWNERKLPSLRWPDTNVK